MIVVIGSPIGRIVDGAIAAGGPSSRVAIAAAAAGRVVQLVGRTGDDATAEGVVLDLARCGVGHVALLRDAARVTSLEPDPPADPEPDDLDDSGATAVTAAPDAGIGPSLDAADVDLGLRYLTDFAVVVLAEPAGADVVRVVADAARWAEARLILVVRPGGAVPADVPADAVIFEAPDGDPDGAFATLVGDVAAALDDGIEPGAAFRGSIEADGWTAAVEG